MKRSLIFIFVVLILSWAYEIFVFSSPQRIENFGYIMFVPAIVALVMNYAHTKSLNPLLKPLTRKIDLEAILFSAFYPIAFIAICALMAEITGLAKINFLKLNALAPKFSAAGISISTLKIFGEEYGWRGFLLPEISKRKGPIFATIIVGVVWATWHGPVLYELAKVMKTADPLKLCLIQMSVVFVFSFPFAYVFFKTGNIIPPMIFHWVWNLYNPIVLGDIYRNKPGIMEGNILFINGEGLFGAVLGVFLIYWFVRRIRALDLSAPGRI